MAHLMPETAREPAMALDGGADGLDFYRLLTAHYRDALRPGGWLVLEIGYAQAEAVLELGKAAGWQAGTCRKDADGIQNFKQPFAITADKQGKPPVNPRYETNFMTLRIRSVALRASSSVSAMNLPSFPIRAVRALSSKNDPETPLPRPRGSVQARENHSSRRRPRPGIREHRLPRWDVPCSWLP